MNASLVEEKMTIVDPELRLAAIAEYDPDTSAYISGALNQAHKTAPHETQMRRSNIRTEKWLDDNENPDVIVVPGIGSETEVLSLLDKLPEESRILLIEKRPEKVASLFLQREIEKLIQENRLRIVNGERDDYLEAGLSSLLVLPKNPSICIFDITKTSPEDAEFYNKLLLNLRDRMRVTLLNLGTLVCLSPHWQLNTIRNLPVIIRHPGTDILENRFKDKPAIVVAAGPSLTAAIPYLRSVQDKFLIISVGTALAPLRKAGIRPHLVVSVDASIKVLRQFDIDCSDLFLVCSLISPPEVLRKFKGIFSAHGSGNSVAKWAQSLGAAKGSIYCGGTVSSSSIDLAVKMGCNPVITVGLDLSLKSDGSSHADHTMYHKEQIKKDHPNLLTVKGNYKEEVQTLLQFRAYIDIIRDYVKRRPEIRFINANDRGASIDGMELVGHEKIPTFGQNDIQAYQALQQLQDQHTPPDISIVEEGLQNAIDQINSLTNDSTEAAMLCNQLIMLLRIPRPGGAEKAQEILDRLENADRKIMEAKDAFMLCDMSLRPAYYSLEKKASEAEERYSDAEFANIRSRDFFQSIIKSGQWTRDLLEGALKEIQCSSINKDTDKEMYT